MGLLNIFTQAIRRQVADAVRLGITDGITAALDGQTPAAPADEAEATCRLLLLPAPEEKPAKRKGVAS